MGSCTIRTPATLGIVAITMVGLLASTLTIPQTCMAGQQPHWAAEFGDTAAWPVMARTCLSSRGTLLTPAVIGWVAKQLFGCKPVQSLIVRRRPLRTIGLL